MSRSEKGELLAAVAENRKIFPLVPVRQKETGCQRHGSKIKTGGPDEEKKNIKFNTECRSDLSEPPEAIVARSPGGCFIAAFFSLGYLSPEVAAVMKAPRSQPTPVKVESLR